MFEDIEFSPVGFAGALLGGILSLIVMSQVEVAMIFRIGAFIGTALVCYFMVGRILER